jgi:hypothetical protein
LSLADPEPAAERQRDYELTFRRLMESGAVELTLRATWRRGAGERTPSGASYLRERLELRQSARRVATELDPLSAVALWSLRTLAPEPGLPVLDAYLVERGRVAEFVALVGQLGDYLDDVDLTCTGPSPPYSFAAGAPVGCIGERAAQCGTAMCSTSSPLPTMTSETIDGGNSPCSTTPGISDSHSAISCGSSNGVM